MAPGESLSAVSIDEAWSDLRHHLDWTRGEGTLVFIATESRVQAGDLRERAALWAQKTGEPWMRVPENDSAAPWLRRHLPQRGILWVDLWDNAVRLAVLHVLNEIRIRFARPGGGCLVLCGPIRLLEEAAREAADLWSIRSFAHAVGSVVPSRAETVLERIEAPPSSDGGYRSVWRVTLLPEMRNEQAAAVLRDVDRVRMLLSSDPVRARRLLDGSKNADSKLAQVLFGLVRAEIGGLLDDVVAVEVNLSSTLKHVADFPSYFQVQVADAALSIGERFGAYDAAAAAAEMSLGVHRSLVDSIGTLESQWDLSVSLDNVGRVAEARSDWGAAGRAYEESLEIRRSLVDSLGMLESRRDLSVSLDNVGRAAWACGDWGVAGRAYEESLQVARGLADVLDTPESRRDLSVSLNNVGRVAEACGDWGVAGRAYEESLEIRRSLVDSLGTPQARQDLLMSLNNVGRVVEVRGDWNTAEQIYDEAFGTFRDLADSLGTPESLRDLVVSLGNLAGVVEQLGDTERAESLRAERDRIAKILDSGSSET